jgi:glycosyltransferase involved in cell wall biosynthesis
MSCPAVTVLTPVYNGEEYLVECIESVLAQDYGDWEYHIVNNCSTDRSLQIAESYAKNDRRIHVHTNSRFVSAIENHNGAFALVPRDSRFCKVVSADDWIMPDCIGKMVNLAETHPNVGIVGCYQRSGSTIKWRGIDPAVSVVSGREAGRLGLLKSVHVFGTPTSVLYRADLLRMRESFFPHPRSYADCSACYEALQHCDFGFLHEILSVERVHSEQWSAAMDKLDAGTVGYLDILLQYGPVYLSAPEFAARKKEVFDSYYRGLGGCLLKLKGREFWNFHRSRLREVGCELAWARIAKAAILEAVTEAKNPVTAMRKVLAVVTGRPTSG